MTPCSKVRHTLSIGGAFLVIALVAGLAACGSGSMAHPDESNQVVLRVLTAGGFVGPSFNLTQEPEFTLYGDGTVIVTGPVAEIYPPHALPNLQAAKIKEDAVQAILSGASDAGLFEANVDYGQPGITDMPTTTISINAGGKSYQTAIYALGADAGAPGLSLQQQQARAAVGAFVGKLQTLTDFVGGQAPDWKPFQFTALQVFSLAITPGGGSPDVQPNRLQWPLGDLSTLGEPTPPDGYRKVVVTGQDLAKLQPLLAQATQITIWGSNGREYNLFFRPLLPDETV